MVQVGWPSGWEIYYVVVLSAMLALGIPAALATLSFLFSRSHKKRPKSRTNEELGEISGLGNRINARFFMAANAALILVAMALVLVPLVGSVQPRGTALRSLLAVVSISSLAALGLLFALRKGDLSWLTTYQKD